MKIRDTKYLLTSLSALLLLSGGLQAEADETPSDKRLAHRTELPFFCSKDYSVAYRGLQGFTNLDTLQLDDGSEWKVDGNDLHRLHYWQAGHSMTITADRGWIDAVNSRKPFLYRLINQSRRSEVSANLFLGSSKYLPAYAEVGAISKGALQTYLTNGSGWTISSDDIELFDQWQTGHTIIVGIYDRWFTSYDYILINVDLNHYVRANQL